MTKTKSLPTAMRHGDLAKSVTLAKQCLSARNVNQAIQDEF